MQAVHRRPPAPAQSVAQTGTPNAMASDDPQDTPPVPAETGERCPECGGTGVRDGQECPACEGTGNVMRGLGGG